MPRLSDTIRLPKKYDRRIKLSAQDKIEIRHAYFGKELFFDQSISPAVSQRTLAKNYGVSRRSIVWVLYPDRLKHNQELRANRGGSKVYYNRAKNTISQREHRNYKRKLFLEGKIGVLTNII